MTPTLRLFSKTKEKHIIRHPRLSTRNPPNRGPDNQQPESKYHIQEGLRLRSTPPEAKLTWLSLLFRLYCGWDLHRVWRLYAAETNTEENEEYAQYRFVGERIVCDLVKSYIDSSANGKSYDG